MDKEELIKKMCSKNVCIAKKDGVEWKKFAPR